MSLRNIELDTVGQKLRLRDRETEAESLRLRLRECETETVLLADSMPKTTYFWHPVSVLHWPFFEFHASFSETAVKLLAVHASLNYVAAIVQKL